MDHSTTKPASFPFPLIPNEVVLWSARPPPRAALSNAFRLPLVITILLLYALIFVFVIAMIPEKENRKVDAPPPEQTDVDASVPADPVSSETRPFPIIFVCAPLTGLLLAWVLFAIATSRTRRYLLTNQRLCIQSGVLWRSERIADLDKIVSVDVTHSPVQRLLRLCSIELTLPGAIIIGQYSFQLPFTVYDIPADSEAAGLLLNTWLPRDNMMSAPIARKMETESSQQEPERVK